MHGDVKIHNRALRSELVLMEGKIRMGGKREGKTLWAGRRRPMTRKSGFSATSQIQIRRSEVQEYLADAHAPLVLKLILPALRESEWMGWGGYVYAPTDTKITVEPKPLNTMISTCETGSWAKFGSLFKSDAAQDSTEIQITITPPREGKIAVYDIRSGLVSNKHLSTARPVLLKKMYLYAPEANFFHGRTHTAKIMSPYTKALEMAEIIEKSCNRCGRFLPINMNSERNQLSFSNHCVARQPCTHSGFGRIHLESSVETVIQFQYGFQLECRFCKKFEVNGALNPQRTSGQMKEDAARRRSLEVLLEQMYEGTPQLRYKNEHGSDLSTDVWTRFEGKCFRCGKSVSAGKKDEGETFHLDHTRPLALLWPLDEHATCLCGSCNSAKRDRSPADFYSVEELARLSKITGLALVDLTNPTPNIAALTLLSNRMPWFKETFLQSPELTKIRDGKRAADLLVKALNKTIALCPDPKPIERIEL